MGNLTQGCNSVLELVDKCDIAYTRRWLIIIMHWKIVFVVSQPDVSFGSFLVRILYLIRRLGIHAWVRHTKQSKTWSDLKTKFALDIFADVEYLSALDLHEAILLSLVEANLDVLALTCTYFIGSSISAVNELNIHHRPFLESCASWKEGRKRMEMCKYMFVQDWPPH